ncbi:MAG TPA: hypothetical protein VEG62_01825 [Acidimicrobiales bacterium]|nr:hypothetical protein [Acidimicrobiales bacterium]
MPKSSDKRPPEPDAGGSGSARNGVARGVSSSSRVNVAFPFSQIKLQEPSRELTDLAAVMVDLVAAMAEWIPEERLEDLRSRAESIYESLR